MKSKSIMLVLTEEEFGALAGAVSTEFRRLEKASPRSWTNRPAAEFIRVRLEAAWDKMLKAWHPDVSEEALAGSDWVPLFDPSFDPNNPQTEDAEVYDIGAYRQAGDVTPA